MPILYSETNRRDFLRIAGGTIAAIVTMGVTKGTARAADTDSMHLALISDTHVPEDVQNNYRGFYPYENMQKVVSQVTLSKVSDGAIITGDLARLEGKVGDYVNLKKLLQPMAAEMPVAMALGNHDHRKHFLQVFERLCCQRQPVEDKIVLVLDHPALRLIILDSLMFTNKTPGLLGKAQRTWLQSYLKTSGDKATLLFVHHTLSDGDNDLLDVDRLFKIIGPARSVKAIVYGHSHRYGYDETDGIHLINLPATGYNFNDKEPVGWVEAMLRADGAELTLRTIGGNRQNDGQVTNLKWRK